MLSKKVVFGLAVILVAYLYSRWSTDSFEELDAKEQSIIEAWNSSIVEPYVQFKKIALGINCNLDLIVPAIKLMEALGLKPGQRLDSVALENLEDLTNTFTHYYTKGAAAERTFTNKEIFKKIIDTAARLENIEHHVGGNAALMALKISQLFPQTQVQLVGPIGPGMKDLLPGTITIPHDLDLIDLDEVQLVGPIGPGMKDLLPGTISIPHDSLIDVDEVQLVGPIGPGMKDLLPGTISIPQDSLIDLDEVHLIMEYSLEDFWGGVKTPVANRFITSHDESNSKLTLIQQYFKNVELFNPDLVLLSGLHLLETQTLDFVKDKIVEVKKGLSKIPDTVPIHLELASMANTDCVKLVINEIIPNVNSLGLNEQEISFSSHVLNGPHSEEFLHRKGQPEIHKISDMVLWLLKTYGYSKTNNPSSKLTRIHFHSLTYHIVGIIPESWHNSKSSVAAGTRMAGQQACGTKSLTPDDIELRIPQSFKLFTGDHDRHFDENSPVISWIRDGYKFHFSPVLVCKSPVKTVGLGDAISSTGLMYSEFNPNYNKL